MIWGGQILTSYLRNVPPEQGGNDGVLHNGGGKNENKRGRGLGLGFCWKKKKKKK